jgi:dihydrofolate synthase/folylpolyglutamate synthase
VEVGYGWAEWQPAATQKQPSVFRLRPFQYPLPLPGRHQLTNSALAIAALQILQQQGWEISDKSIVQGMAKTQWPGRLQWFEWRNRSFLIDGAHNPAGAEMLRHYVDHSDRVRHPICWVMGMVRTKDHADVFKALLRSRDSLFLVPVPDHLSADLTELAKIALAIYPDLKTCRIYKDVTAGVEAAIQSTSEDATIVLCGSLYLIGHFFKRTAWG